MTGTSPTPPPLHLSSGGSTPTDRATLSALGGSDGDVAEPEPVGAAAAAAVLPLVSSAERAAVVEAGGVYTGWMFKKGESTNTWTRRYFVCSLDSATLSYYDKPGGPKRATIDLAACNGVRQISIPVRHYFCARYVIQLTRLPAIGP